MGRFDIYSNPGKGRAKVPYLLDVQSNIVSSLATRVVVPLRPIALLASFTLPADMFPLIHIDGADYFLDTPQLGAIPASELKNKIGSGQMYQLEIQGALDRLFGAF